ncbi:hypothetical protein ACE14D_16285 [Streptomyces sp. Act-28]
MDATVPLPLPHQAASSPAGTPRGRDRQTSVAGHGLPPGGGSGELPPVRHALVCVVPPGSAGPAEHGRLTGQAPGGVHQSGCRLLSRGRPRAFDHDSLTVQARLVLAGRARFVAVVRTPADLGILPCEVGDADGSERITLHKTTGRPLRLPVELVRGRDLAALGAVVAGRSGVDLQLTVHGSGFR